MEPDISALDQLAAERPADDASHPLAVAPRDTSSVAVTCTALAG